MLELWCRRPGKDVSEESAKKNGNRWLFSPQACVRLATLAVICPVLGLFGKHHWFLDLFNHMQMQYFVFLLLLVVVLSFSKKPFHCAIAVAALMLPTSRLAPLYSSSNTPSEGPALRAAAFNVLGSNERYDETLAWTLESDPDLIYFSETGPKWTKALEALKSRYPYKVGFPYKGNFGFCFFSKYPILEKQVEFLGKLQLPLLEAVVDSPHGPITVFGAHPVPPVSGFWANEQDIYLKDLTRRCQETESHAVILGDLNATRWSTQLDGILDDYDDSSIGQGYSATWMRKNWLVTIPIDHIFSRGFKGTIKRTTGPDLGSDHRPVMAELAW
ncbi:endonuclease/exonuclease/phosphatase family protein [Haloferula sp.]|uniref:endonuclease/exonuclease/phosphatase family protein n=1 Tax=Haloferula sp. TaxID=2497595 RepID=UPI0032A04AA8